MELIIQDLSNAKPKIEKHFRKRPGASISAMYRQLRHSPRYSLIGDYPILSLIVSTVSELGIVIKPLAVRRAMRLSPELKGQKLILTQLFNPQLTLRNSPQMPANSRISEQTIHTSSERKQTYV